MQPPAACTCWRGRQCAGGLRGCVSAGVAAAAGVASLQMMRPLLRRVVGSDAGGGVEVAGCMLAWRGAAHSLPRVTVRCHGRARAACTNASERLPRASSPLPLRHRLLGMCNSWARASCQACLRAASPQLLCCQQQASSCPNMGKWTNRRVGFYSWATARRFPHQHIQGRQQGQAACVAGQRRLAQKPMQGLRHSSH